MKYEICLNESTNIRFHEICRHLLTNDALERTNIVLTKHSNFWEATEYILDSTSVSCITKVQIVTCFLYAGGNVKFNGQFYKTSQEYSFWKYLLEHQFISEDEYYSLK